jgi:hypothetical protein
MNKALLLSAVLAMTAACKPPKYIEPEPEPIEPPTPPMERILRLPVDYSFQTSDGKKEYRLRLYADEELTDNIVTVLDGGPYERYATPAEFEFAMGEFSARWEAAGQEEQIAFHRRVWDEAAAKRASGLDDMIARKRERIVKLENDWWELKSDVDSRVGTGFKEKDKEDPLPHRQQELARLDGLLVAEKARLQVLENQKYLRDGGADPNKLAAEIDKLKGLLDK